METAPQEKQQGQYVMIHNLRLLNAGVVRELRLSPYTIHAVSGSRSKSKRIAMKLAEMIDTQFEILFPEYFANK